MAPEQLGEATSKFTKWIHTTAITIVVTTRWHFLVINGMKQQTHNAFAYSSNVKRVVKMFGVDSPSVVKLITLFSFISIRKVWITTAVKSSRH